MFKEIKELFGSAVVLGVRSYIKTSLCIVRLIYIFTKTSALETASKLNGRQETGEKVWFSKCGPHEMFTRAEGSPPPV